MAYLTTNSVLDLALGKQHDTSSALRVKALAWLNEAMQKLYLERDWICLDRTAELTATDNAVTKPADYGRFRYAQSTTSGQEFFLDGRDRLTDREAYQFVGDGTANPVPAGFTESATAITFLPGTTGTVTLGYTCILPSYADNATTLLDAKFTNLLARSVLSAVYEYEQDHRTIPSIQLDAGLLASLKAEENRQRPIAKRSKYLRGR